MKKLFPKMDHNIRPTDFVVRGKPENKQGLLVPEIVVKYGSLRARIKTMPFYANYLLGSMLGLHKAVRMILKNPHSGKREISQEALHELLEYSHSLGISDIGFTKVSQSHLFRSSAVLFQNAIVLTMEMRRSEIECAPSIRTTREIFRTYYKLGRAVNLVSAFLQARGYNAQPIPAISNFMNLTVMARDAGLGDFGKSGLLITREYGPSVRFAAVLTDIENLPFNEEVSHNWISNFCSTCNACVRKCPAHAIFDKPIVFDDGSEEHINFKKCAVPFSKDGGCSVCIKECAFFRSSYAKIETLHKNRISDMGR